MRLGEWDLGSNSEPIPYKEYPVAATLVHPGFKEPSAKNDIAVLRLWQSVMLGEFPTIGTGCLPCKFQSDF